MRTFVAPNILMLACAVIACSSPEQASLEPVNSPAEAIEERDSTHTPILAEQPDTPDSEQPARQAPASLPEAVYLLPLLNEFPGFGGINGVPEWELEETDFASARRQANLFRELTIAASFGGPFVGTTIFLVDCSDAMASHDVHAALPFDARGAVLPNPTRMQIVRRQLVDALCEFDELTPHVVIGVGGSSGIFQLGGWQNEQPGSVLAAECEEKLVAGGDADLGAALLSVFRPPLAQYVDNLVIISAGQPNRGLTRSQILAVFPAWYAGMRDNACRLTCVHVGSDQAGWKFMQDLATQNGGTLIRP